MPAKKKTAAKKKSSAKVSSVQSKRPARSSSGLAKAGSKRKGSPSSAVPAKKGVGARKGASESEGSGPSRQTTRGRSASRQKEEPKPRGGSKTSHVTRAAVEEVETKKAAPRGRSKTPSTPKAKKVTPQISRQSKVEAQSPKQKKATPKQKAATPRQRSATPKSRAATPKQKAVTPKSKPGPQKNTPKAKNTPKQSAKLNKKTTPTKTIKKTPQKKQELPKRGSSKSRKTEEESEIVSKSSVSEKKSSPRKTPTKQETTPPKPASRSPRKGKDDKEADSDNKGDGEQEHTDEPDGKEVSQAATIEQASDVKIDEEESKEDIKDADNDGEDKEGVEEDKVEGVEEDEIEAMETEEELNEDENVEQDQVVGGEVDQPEVANSVENNELAKADQPDSADPDENDEPEATEEQEEEGQSSKSVASHEEKEAKPDDTEKHSNDSVEKDNEEDVTESQAESEQVESDDKECESAESEQVEADTPLEASNVGEAEPIVINEDSGDVADPEIISDGSEDSGDKAMEVNEDKVIEVKEDKVIEVNEDSDSAVIILDSKEVGSGDQAEQGNNVSKVLDAEENSSSFTEIDKETGVEIADEAMENDAPSSSEPVGNGLDKQDDSEAKKRKIDEVEEVEDSGESSKKAKVLVSENNLENGTVSKEEENIDDEFVVIEMSDVPPIDSSEVQESIPKESVTNSVDKDLNPIFNRDFVPNPAFSGPGDILKQFSVVSYNILADCHLFRNDYSFTENKFLVPEYRLEKIIEELKYLDGDIICMQEVDPAFFSEKLLPSLQSIGYEGYHKKRTAEYFNEGEATFYKTGRFTVVECQLHRQADLIEKVLSEGSVDEGVQDAIRKYVDMPDVLVVTKLRCNNTGSEVTVGNVHINWGEMKTPDIQCVQITSAVKETYRIASAIKETVSKAGSDNVPHIICGDFNSPPLSPGYLVARDGYPSGDDTITKLQQTMGIQLPEEKMDSLVNCLWPAFQHTSSSLKSAYSEAQGKEPEITSYNQVMCECVDYIFYSSTSIDNVGVYRVPSKEKLMETGGTPNLYFPSDHVSVKALLSFK